MKNEPVLTALTGLVTAGLALLVAFGVDFTTAQTTAIGGFVLAVYTVGALVRSWVRPVGKVASRATLKRTAHVESRNRRT